MFIEKLYLRFEEKKNIYIYIARAHTHTHALTHDLETYLVINVKKHNESKEKL